MRDIAFSRYCMIERHLRSRGVADPRVLEAMENVPREDFIHPRQAELAYEDSPLAIGHGQTISQPFIVALMIASARIRPGDVVLEVGTGSGYAAAVISRIAAHVYTLERIGSLTELARRRFKRLGYNNIVARTGDGSLGWPESDPFDAIIVAAAAPAVPEALKQQLTIGGRLIIPVGSQGAQRLVRITRTGNDAFEEDDLGGVLFVPLLGEQGWEGGDDPPGKPSLPAHIAQAAEQLPDPSDPAFGRIFDRFAEKRVVLLGEATHGTSEFYRARAAITQHLIKEHGFAIVAVEADWPDAAEVNRYIRGRDPISVQAPFTRFPTWMWRNREVGEFIGWLLAHNRAVADSARMAGFYGLDLYNLNGSIEAVLRYLDQVDPDAAKAARERYGCLTPWRQDPAHHGHSTLDEAYGRCEEAVVAQCRELLQRQMETSSGDEDLFDAAQSARLIASAERYYRLMYRGGPDSWNLRDTHMFETLDQLMAAGGPEAKAVVWAHNSHIGDARQTDMGWRQGEVNIGQLCRERYGSDVALIGFGTHSGSVAAASDWNGPMETKRIRSALAESVEDLFHAAGVPRCLLDLTREPDLAAALCEPRLQRFIGVIYQPETERFSHYMEAALGAQFDAFVWFDETTPVTALPGVPETGEAPELFPFGL